MTCHPCSAGRFQGQHASTECIDCSCDDTSSAGADVCVYNSNSMERLECHLSPGGFICFWSLLGVLLLVFVHCARRAQQAKCTLCKKLQNRPAARAPEQHPSTAAGAAAAAAAPIPAAQLLALINASSPSTRAKLGAALAPPPYVRDGAEVTVTV